MVSALPSAGVGDIGVDLTALVGRGGVRVDPEGLDLYSTDASLYRVRPRAVVLPRETVEVSGVVAYAHARGLPVTPRGAGTSLSGSAIGQGIVVDMSRSNRILGTDAPGRWVRIQAGIGLKELNEALGPLDLFFPPDPGSQEACRLGGMLGHNASGPRSVKYGSTKHYAERLTVVLADGKAVGVRNYDLGEPELERLLAAEPGLRAVRDLVEANQGLLRSRRPRVKNASGYNLFDLAEGLARGRFELPKLFVGAEGTLGIITEATLRLVPRPRRRVLLLAFFQSVEGMGRAVMELLALHPSALEAMDGNSMDLLGRPQYGFPRDAVSSLLIEFDEGDLESLVEKASAVCGRHGPAGEARAAWRGEEQEGFWAARRTLLLKLYTWPGRAKPWTCAEDVAVPPERLPEFLKGLDALTLELGLAAGLYGHVGDGNIHYRPILDLAAPGGADKFPAFTRRSTTSPLPWAGVLVPNMGTVATASASWPSSLARMWSNFSGRPRLCSTLPGSSTQG
jgi:FAD/FMN-containing dehydrogenase